MVVVLAAGCTPDQPAVDPDVDVAVLLADSAEATRATGTAVLRRIHQVEPLPVAVLRERGLVDFPLGATVVEQEWDLGVAEALRRDAVPEGGPAPVLDIPRTTREFTMGTSRLVSGGFLGDAWHGPTDTGQAVTMPEEVVATGDARRLLDPALQDPTAPGPTVTAEDGPDGPALRVTVVLRDPAGPPDAQPLDPPGGPAPYDLPTLDPDAALPMPGPMLDVLPAPTVPFPEPVAVLQQPARVVATVLIDADTLLLTEVTAAWEDLWGSSWEAQLRDHGNPDPLVVPPSTVSGEDYERLRNGGSHPALDDHGLPPTWPSPPDLDLTSDLRPAQGYFLLRMGGSWPTRTPDAALAEVQAHLAAAGWDPRPGSTPQGILVARGPWGGHVEVSASGTGARVDVRLGANPQP